MAKYGVDLLPPVWAIRINDTGWSVDANVYVAVSVALAASGAAEQVSGSRLRVPASERCPRRWTNSYRRCAKTST